MKKKKKKVNKKKFLSRIFLLLTIFIVLIFIVTRKPSKKEAAKYEATVIVNNENITNSLAHAPYINKDNVLYLSVEDVGKIFDKNIYFEPETRKIITTSATAVAALDVANNILELNGGSMVLTTGALDYGDTQSIPISELGKVYNIEAFTTEKSAVISSLHEDFVTIKATKKISLREKPDGFAHKIRRIDEGEELIYIEDSDKKNWLKVLTYKRRNWLY
ncbi:MAG: SH3 domain-containing protein [Clostridia bacterium]|nr:SH3 domain-containing protein [Clostridia bacterium]